MRDTLENLYFGNITPNDQIVKSGTALKKAMEQSAECEEKLTALLEDKEKTLLLRLINAENEIGSTMALENFILGFRLALLSQDVCKPSCGLDPCRIMIQAKDDFL